MTDLFGDRKLSAESDEQYTPTPILEAARQALGGVIEFDPASSVEANKNVRADRFLTVADDALKVPLDMWWGKTFINPPYSRGNPDAFYARLVLAYKTGLIPEFVGIHNIDPSTAWYATLSRVITLECYLHSRVQFIKPRGVQGRQNLRPQFVFYCGCHGERFIKAFKPFGYLRSVIRG